MMIIDMEQFNNRMNAILDEMKKCEQIYLTTKSQMAAMQQELQDLIQELQVRMNDPLWNCWFDVASHYEPCTGKYDQPEYTYAESVDTATDTDTDTEMDIQPIYAGAKKDRTKRAQRRRATAMHKRKIRRNVAAIVYSYGERESEDMRNGSYRKRKNGDRINTPKSKTYRAEELLKQAAKSNVLPENLKEDIWDFLGKWSLKRDEVPEEVKAKIRERLERIYGQQKTAKEIAAKTVPEKKAA